MFVKRKYMKMLRVDSTIGETHLFESSIELFMLLLEEGIYIA